MLLWLLVWVVLLVVAGLVLFGSGRMLWRKGVALAHELGEASDRLSPALDRLEAATPDRPAPELAVFDDPVRLRRERDQDRDRRARAARRRSGRSPGRA